MNFIQLVIMIIFLIISSGVIIYYFYQEAKFKKLVTENFNKSSIDNLSNDHSLVLDGFDEYNQEKKTILQQDIANSAKNTINLDNDEILPADSMEAMFTKYDAFEFRYPNNNLVDFTIDVFFDKIIKSKFLPEFAGLSAKAYRVYILEKDGIWSLYQRTKKYQLLGFKLQIELIDDDGLLNEIQIQNIYQQLRDFALKYAGIIRISDYHAQINEIKQQLPHIIKFNLNFELFLMSKDALSYWEWEQIFIKNGLKNNNGVFVYYNHKGIGLFVLSNEDGGNLGVNNFYNILLIKTKLHLQNDPVRTIDLIFDLGENIMQHMEARLLTNKHQIFNETDYTNLLNQVNNFVITAKKNGITLGGALVNRIFA